MNLQRESLSQEWVGELVELEFIEVAGERHALVGWLRGVTERGVYFARAFYCSALNKYMPGETASFYPWGLVAEIRGLSRS
ncbi:hypothetical protein RxyAA322_16610 [Rubrobacter xylanophilus]|uniref:Uncharacterized protein n=1 Tax=Rubrobacter xylanophilus TaxID=49319 RepID=A0A510HMX1_9ACTN|nr:hypothetical protein [Rubrobacter xylanophilus]BBL79807.1 hypothetical protein RxyAA322_16610 [Rubrobacter xylanophilus]